MAKDWLVKWNRSFDAGISSKTIASVLGGEGAEYILDTRPDTPGDTSDFNRCVKLLDKAQEAGEDWRARLDEVVEAYPTWKPLVDHWELLEQALAEDIIKQKKPWPVVLDYRKKRGFGPLKHPRKRRVCPPSRTWHILSLLHGFPDPCEGQDVPWPRFEPPAVKEGISC